MATHANRSNVTESVDVSDGACPLQASCPQCTRHPLARLLCSIHARESENGFHHSFGFESPLLSDVSIASFRHSSSVPAVENRVEMASVVPETSSSSSESSSASSPSMPMTVRSRSPALQPMDVDRTEVGGSEELDGGESSTRPSTEAPSGRSGPIFQPQAR